MLLREHGRVFFNCVKFKSPFRITFCITDLLVRQTRKIVELNAAELVSYIAQISVVSRNLYALFIVHFYFWKTIFVYILVSWPEEAKAET